jgi:hypothetical protein
MIAKPQAGDFGLVAIKGFPGRAIWFGQGINKNGWRDYQHAVLCVGDDEVVQAEPGGATIVPVSTYDGTNIVWSHWSDEILTSAVRDSIAKHGRALEGVGYSALDYGAIALHRFGINPPGLREFIANTGHMICSELVDEGITRGLVEASKTVKNVFNDGRWAGYVTPLALYPILGGPQ